MTAKKIIRVYKICVLIFSLVVVSLPGYAAAPGTINYQGRLTDSVGVPIDGSVDVVFRLYDIASGGTPLWEETDTISVSKGYFSVELGRVTTLNPALFSNQLYLGVQVGTDSEMTPRQSLSASPYSFATSSSGSTGNGAVQMTASTITIYQNAAGCIGGGKTTFEATCVQRDDASCGTYFPAGCGFACSYQNYLMNCDGSCSTRTIDLRETCNNPVLGTLVKQ